jgi:hypothetical protein
VKLVGILAFSSVSVESESRVCTKTYKAVHLSQRMHKATRTRSSSASYDLSSPQDSNVTLQMIVSTGSVERQADLSFVNEHNQLRSLHRLKMPLSELRESLM